MVRVQNCSNSWVIEDGRAFFKVHTMLLEIAACFFVIPFKFWIFHNSYFPRLYSLLINAKNQVPSSSALCCAYDYLRRGTTPSKTHHHSGVSAPAMASAHPNP